MNETAQPEISAPPPLSKPVESVNSSVTPQPSPKNSKFFGIFAFILAGIMLAAALTLFYFYIRQRGTIQTLQSENESLQSENESLQNELDNAVSSSTENSEQLELLLGQISELEEELETATALNTTYAGNLSKIEAYNNLMDYTFERMALHVASGTSFTEQEYRAIANLADKTGNKALEDAIDTAWNDASVPAWQSFLTITDIIISSIDKLV